MSKENTINLLDQLQADLKEDAAIMVRADARRMSLSLSTGYVVAFKSLEEDMLKCITIVRESFDDTIETSHSTEFLAENFAKGDKVSNALDELRVAAKQLLGLTKSEI